jgi:hypothetical protein
MQAQNAERSAASGPPREDVILGPMSAISSLDKRCPAMGVVIVLGALGAACTSSSGNQSAPSPSASPASPESPAAPTQASAAEPAGPATPMPPAQPVAPRPFVFLREARGERLEVWLPGAEPAGARSLGIISDSEGGSLDHGTTTPRLSPDGEWLAVLTAGKLWVHRIDGSQEKQITKHQRSRVDIYITGWSPDSQTLLFYQGEVQTMTGAPLPRGVKPGFHLLRLADMQVEHVDAVESFAAWQGDNHGWLYQARTPQRATALMRFDSTARTSEALHEIKAPFGFGHLDVHGDHIAYVGDKQVVRSRLDGSGREELTPTGDFAQYGPLVLSPDGTRLAYLSRLDLEVVELGPRAKTTLARCSDKGCQFAWESPTSILLVDKNTLQRVGLDGTSTVVASDVALLVTAGE